VSALQHAAGALALMPPAARIVILMRHAERSAFAKGHHGNDAHLTPQGKKDAAAMGALLKERNIELHHSPVHRCLQTARGIGAVNHARPVAREWMPLRCDAYLDNFELALPTLGRLIREDGFYDVFVNKLSHAARHPPYPHFRDPFLATAALLAGLLPRDRRACIGVTHDWLVNVAASHATGRVTSRETYADFLDALFIWADRRAVYYYHKGRSGRCPPAFRDAFFRAVENGGTGG